MSAPPSRRLGPAAAAAVGGGAAVLALTPWLATGAHLPQQDLWTDPVPFPMPTALLPLSQYRLTDVLALLVVGSAVAGAALRLLRRSGLLTIDRRSVLGACAGVLGVQAVAVAQSLAVVASGLADRTASAVYLVALVLLVSVGAATGLTVLLLLTARPRALPVLGVAVVAVLVDGWLWAALPFLGGAGSGGRLGSGGWPSMPWVAPVLVGGAIGWAGLRSRGRVAAAAASLLALWAGPAVITAVTTTASYRAAARYPAELLGYGTQVVEAAMLRAEPVLHAVLLVVVAAAVVAITSSTARRLGARRPPAATEAAIPAR